MCGKAQSGLGGHRCAMLEKFFGMLAKMDDEHPVASPVECHGEVYGHGAPARAPFKFATAIVSMGQWSQCSDVQPNFYPDVHLDMAPTIRPSRISKRESLSCDGSRNSVACIASMMPRT